MRRCPIAEYYLDYATDEYLAGRRPETPATWLDGVRAKRWTFRYRFTMRRWLADALAEGVIVPVESKGGRTAYVWASAVDRKDEEDS